MGASKITPEGLTLKQKAFLIEYIANGGNGTLAALEAYDAKNPETASAIAVENLRKPSVRDALQQMLAQTEKVSLPGLVAELNGVVAQNKHFPAKVNAIKVALQLWDAFPRIEREPAGKPHEMKKILGDVLEIEAESAESPKPLVLKEKSPNRQVTSKANKKANRARKPNKKPNSSL